MPPLTIWCAFKNPTLSRASPLSCAWLMFLSVSTQNCRPYFSRTVELVTSQAAKQKISTITTTMARKIRLLFLSG